MSWMLGFRFSLAFNYMDLLLYFVINYFELDMKFNSYLVFKKKIV